MKFSIITPTYKRADMLSRAVASALNQTYTDWEMTIVNDSPEDESYAAFEKTLTDPRITYLKNDQNMGVNYSRNFALENLSSNSSFIIFLDDDDWLAKDAMENFANLNKERPNENWFVTNRVLKSGGPLTSAPKNNSNYSYAWSYLILKRIQGDATHCIRTNVLKDIQFLKSIKQGEEWFFFYQIGLKNKIFYNNYASTITDGYNRVYGLNFRERTRIVQFKTLLLIIHEGYNLNLLLHPTFLIYLFMRLLRLFVVM